MKEARQRRRHSGHMLALSVLATLLILVAGGSLLFILIAQAGSRELHNAVDAGTLNLAKTALRHGGFSPDSIPNPEVASNFSTLTDEGKLDLLVYNRVVAQSYLVALNAKNENTMEAAVSARKVWEASNDVGAQLRQRLMRLERTSQAGEAMASANNLKMLGNSRVSCIKYSCGYTARGTSSNIYMPLNVTERFSDNRAFPVNTNNIAHGDGNKYLAGFKPLTVEFPASGESLTYCAVPLPPQRLPHLVSTSELSSENSTEGESGATVASLPVKVVPPNLFFMKAAAGSQRYSLSAESAAMTTAIGKDFPLSIPGGYIEIRNNASLFSKRLSNKTLLKIWRQIRLHATADLTNCPFGEGTQRELLARTQQVLSTVGPDDLAQALDTLVIPPGATHYLYVEQGHLVMTANFPSWGVPGTTADGQTCHCGDPPGGFPLYMRWTPASGYRHLLGRIEINEYPQSENQDDGSALNQENQTEREERQAEREARRAEREARQAEREARRAEREARRAGQ